MGATPYPFIRLTLALVCGILLGEYYFIGTVGQQNICCYFS